jgi:hypothetical protein
MLIAELRAKAIDIYVHQGECVGANSAMLMERAADRLEAIENASLVTVGELQEIFNEIQQSLNYAQMWDKSSILKAMSRAVALVYKKLK